MSFKQIVKALVSNRAIPRGERREGVRQGHLVAARRRADVADHRQVQSLWQGVLVQCRPGKRPESVMSRHPDMSSHGRMTVV